jgi:hypothetical protein
MHVNIDKTEDTAKNQCVSSFYHILLTSEVEICKDNYYVIDDTFKTHNLRYVHEQSSGSTKFIRDENRFFLSVSESDLTRYLESGHHVDPAKSEISNHPIFYRRHTGYVSRDFMLPEETCPCCNPA